MNYSMNFFLFDKESRVRLQSRLGVFDQNYEEVCIFIAGFY
jgi:hypothetical protein